MLRASQSSKDGSVLLAPRLKFKAGGKLSADGDNPEQSTFRPSKKAQSRRSKSAVVELVATLTSTGAKRSEAPEPKPVNPSLVVSEVVRTELGQQVANMAGAGERRSETEQGAVIEGLDLHPLENRDGEREAIALNAPEMNDVATKTSRGLRRYDLWKTAKQGKLRHGHVDSEPLELVTPLGNRLSVGYSALAEGMRRCIDLLPPFLARSRIGIVVLQNQVADSLRLMIARGAELTSLGRLKAAQAGQTCWLALKQGYAALHSKVMAGWPRLVSKARKVRSSCADLAKIAAKQGHVWAKKAGIRLTSSFQQLGPLTHRTLGSATASIAKRGANLAKTASGLVAGARSSAPFSAFLERLTPRLPSFNLSGIGSKIRAIPAIKGSNLAATGLAAASVALAVLIVGYTQLAPSAEASLTFPLPERPVSADLSRADAAFDESADPLDSILSYIVAQSSTSEPEAPGFASPVLAKVAALEGFDEFLRAAKIVDLEQLLTPGEAYTIFLPNDAAFAKLDPEEVEDLLEPTGHERLLTLLSHHIVRERMTLDGLKSGAGPHMSLAGRELSVGGGDSVQVGDASIVDTDLEAANSILHVIDGVLAFPEL